jgi:single-strand DNA-binding protein
MSNSYQMTIIVGNVGRDPEMRYTPQGVAVCDFTVAVNKVTGKAENRKEETTWFKVTTWRERAEIASQYVKKGMLILVEGEVKTSAYTNKEGKPMATLELTASDFKFLSTRGENGTNGSGSRADEQDEYAEQASDIPF